MAALEDAIKLVRSEEARVLLEARVRLQAAVAEKPTAENLRALRETTTSLDALQDAGSNKAASKLPNIPAVVDYLTSRGYAVAQSSVYEHQKSGKLRGPAKGPFVASDVEEYARTFLKRAPGAAEQSEPEEDHAKKKASAEARKILAQAEYWERKTKIEEGVYVERALFEHELAARARIFKSDLENFARSEAGALISVVQGDSTHTPDLVEFLLKEFAKILGRYAANNELKVPQHYADADESGPATE